MNKFLAFGCRRGEKWDVSLLLLLTGPLVARESSVMSSALRSGGMAKGILLILFLFSIASWAIMAAKFISFRTAGKESKEFLKVFKKENDPSYLLSLCQRFKHNHLTRILKAGYLEGTNPGRYSKRLSPEEIRENLEIAISSEVLHLEEMLVFLAIGGSVCPLLGLLGTVWGVMNAFLGMETFHSATISAVAPGISDALITTIAGLAAAIPAVVGYNYFVNRIRAMTTEMENFAYKFVGRFEKR
jgi:biopolymer transport protein TolQ